MTTRRIIPFGRPLRLGARGRDVVAVKRAIARWRKRKIGRPTRLLGPFAVRDLKAFQRAHGIAPVTGNYGPKTHAALSRHFDDYALWLYNGATPSLEDRQRRAIVAAALLAHSKRARISYTQSGLRMQGVRERIRPPAVPRWEDCSSFATWLYWLADAPDPNGRGYDGFGYTGTLCRQGRRVSILELQPGDLVFYGRGAPWGHVAIYVGGGKVVSHGSEGGPYLLPVRYRGDVGEARSYL